MSWSAYLVTDQSHDIVGIVELNVPPGWAGPPLHHHDFDEAFYVLDGELTFQLGEQLSATVSTDTTSATDKPYPETIVVGPTIPDRLGRTA